MIISIIEKVSDAESLLNSLNEAEFDLGDVSVLMANTKERDKIAGDTGPLKGVTPSQLAEKLKQLGLAEKETKSCADAVNNGKIVVVMNVLADYSAAAEEIFQDHSASLIKGS